MTVESRNAGPGEDSNKTKGMIKDKSRDRQTDRQIDRKKTGK